MKAQKLNCVVCGQPCFHKTHPEIVFSNPNGIVICADCSIDYEERDGEIRYRKDLVDSGCEPFEPWIIEDEPEEESDRIFYGQDEGSIWTDEGKERLWKEEKIVYIGGVHAFRIIERENYTPLVELYCEDDGALFTYEEGVKFDSSHLKNLKNLIDATIKKLSETE